MHDWRAEVRTRLAGARLHPEEEAEIVEEVTEHLEAQFAELALRIGATSAREQLVAELAQRSFDEALTGRRRRAALRRQSIWDGTFRMDFRYGLRSLRRAPGTVLSATAALALGIGLTAVMFSIIYGLLIKGLPFEDAEHIATIYRADPTGRGQEDLVPFGDFVEYQARQHSFVAFGGYSLGPVSLVGGDHAERVEAARVAGTTLDIARVRPLIGRLFTAADNVPEAPPTALLSYALWRDRFASDSNVLNHTIRVDGRRYAIVGVMPDGFQFPSNQKLWLALQSDALSTRPGEGVPLVLGGRLRRGVSYEQANAELLGISRQLESAYADSGATRTTALPYIRARMPSRVYALLYSMLGAVFLVLLVACANVANLLLDRAVHRTREIGIRFALGASRTAVIRQSLVESSIIAAFAALLGTGLAQWGIVGFNRAMVSSGDVPFWMDVRLHLPVLLFVLAVAAVASLVSGILPAIHTARLDINAILKDETQGASSRRVGRLSRLIVVGEIAVSSVMLLAAGFMTKSIWQLHSFAPRFSTADVFTAQVSPSSNDPAAQRRTLESIEQGLTTTPGVTSMYMGNGLPGAGWQGVAFAVEGQVYPRRQERPVTRWLAVSPGFFRTFDVGVVRGREIQAADRAGAPLVGVVSEAFAQRYFRGVDPLGKRIRLGDSTRGQWLTVVGVIPTLFAAGAVSLNGNHFPPELLTSLWQERDWRTVRIALRAPAAVANATTLRKVVTAADPDVPVYSTASMTEVLNQPTWPARIFGTLFIIFGIISLVLAAVGLYAVMAFSTSRRVREMGIRIALGATRGHVIRLVCWQGGRQILVGMGIGLIAGCGLVQAIRAILFEVRPNDPVVFAIVAAVLGGAAFIACFIPAVRATRVDPLVALRTD